MEVMKEMLIELLKEYPEGLYVNDLCEMLGVDERRLQAIVASSCNRDVQIFRKDRIYRIAIPGAPDPREREYISRLKSMAYSLLKKSYQYEKMLDSNIKGQIIIDLETL